MTLVTLAQIPEHIHSANKSLRSRLMIKFLGHKLHIHRFTRPLAWIFNLRRTIEAYICRWVMLVRISIHEDNVSIRHFKRIDLLDMLNFI
jgi:hypothetical protein